MMGGFRLRLCLRGIKLKGKGRDNNGAKELMMVHMWLEGRRP